MLERLQNTRDERNCNLLTHTLYIFPGKRTPTFYLTYGCLSYSLHFLSYLTAKRGHITKSNGSNVQLEVRILRKKVQDLFFFPFVLLLGTDMNTMAGAIAAILNHMKTLY